MVNGKPLNEPYVRERPGYSLAPMMVPPGELFVLGDNRNQSVDSHVWGSVPVANVVGKAFYVLWPVNRQGFVDELMQNLEVTRDATAFVEEVTEVTERKLEDLGFEHPDQLHRLRAPLPQRSRWSSFQAAFPAQKRRLGHLLLCLRLARAGSLAQLRRVGGCRW